MKTTKKGFTLIELIVVIAIIGVLAAILVPTMLGYVRKSKISSANSAASSVYKAINSALTELDEEGIDIGGDLYIHYVGGTTDTWSNTTTPADDTLAAVLDESFKRKVSNFFADIKKEKHVCAGVTGGSCVAVACAADSTYCGTYPGGVTTTDTYKFTEPEDEDAVKVVLVHAIHVADGGKVTLNSNETGIESTEGDARYADLITACS